MVKPPLHDEKARLVLEAFRQFERGPGDALLPRSILTAAMQRGWQPQDMEEGVALGINLGWFEQGDNNFIRLTAAGFAEL